MTTLQTISLGNAPDGSGGDTVRSANAKVNANSAILDACVTLGYQIVSANKTLAATDAGSRFGLVFQAAGGIVVLPLANSVRQNGIVHFFNIGAQAVNIGFQASDAAQITRVNAGDWVQYASDGNAFWHVVARGRLTWDEVIGGALTTAGSITSGGLLTAPNVLATTIDASGSGGQIRAVQGGYGAILRNDGFAVYLMSTDKNNAMGGFNALRPFWWNLVTGQVTIAGDGAKTTIGGALTVNGQILAPEGTAQAPGISFQNEGASDTGIFHVGEGVVGMSSNGTEIVRYTQSGASFSARPTFSGNVPWDTGNLPKPITTKAFFSGSTASLANATVQGCGWTYQSAGRVRITFTGSIRHSAATDSLVISGISVSNGTNWCVPAILGIATDGSYVDIGALPTGNGSGGTPEMILSLTVLTVR